MDVDLGEKAVVRRQDDEILALPDLLALLQRFASHPRRGVHDLPVPRRSDRRLVNLVGDLLVTLHLLAVFAFLRPQVALRLGDGGRGLLPGALERHALLLDVALVLGELPPVRECLEKLKLAFRRLKRQLARLPAELVALELRLGDELLLEEPLRPFVLVFRLLDLLFADCKLSLLRNELCRILAVLVLVKVLLGEGVVLLGKLHIARGLVLLDVQFLLRNLQRTLGVLEGDLLTVLFIDFRGRVQLHQKVASLHDLPLRHQRNDRTPTLHLALDGQLLARGDLTVLLDIDDERPLLHRRVQGGSLRLGRSAAAQHPHAPSGHHRRNRNLE